MAKCSRKKCQEEISANPEAAKKRLCDKHYRTFRRNEYERYLQSERQCKYCKKPLSGSRNKIYCSAKHRQLGSRKISEQLIFDITHYSYWFHIQEAIKRNPLQLGSIDSIDDIVDFFNLYIRKATHQRSYYAPCPTASQSRPTPLLRLEVCHRYPNSKGGANTSMNLFLGPSRINRMVKDTIPDMSQGAEFCGVKSPNAAISMKSSLYDALVDKFGLEKLTESLQRVKKPRLFTGNVFRHVEFTGTPSALPLYSLFTEEIRRANPTHTDWLDILSNLRKQFGLVYPLYVELIAAMGFYAVLTGDRKRFLQRLFRFPQVYTVHQCRAVHHRSYGKFMSLLIRKYMMEFFSVDVKGQENAVHFYNSLFTQDMVRYQPWDNELVFFIYEKGKRREYYPTFSALPSLPQSPYRNENGVFEKEFKLF